MVFIIVATITVTTGADLVTRTVACIKRRMKPGEEPRGWAALVYNENFVTFVQSYVLESNCIPHVVVS